MREKELRRRYFELRQKESIRDGKWIPQIIENRISIPREEIKQENFRATRTAIEKDYREVPVKKYSLKGIAYHPTTERLKTEESRISYKNIILPPKQFNEREIKEIPATLSKPTSEELSEPGRDLPIGETGENYLRPTTEKKLQELTKKPISSAYSKQKSERISDNIRERELGTGEVRSQTNEKKFVDIRKEIAEIEKRENPPWLNKDMVKRDEKDSTYRIPFSKNIINSEMYEQQKYNKKIEVEDYNKNVNTDLRIQPSNTSQIKTESELDRNQISSESKEKMKTPLNKKKKYKKLKKKKCIKILNSIIK